MTMDWRVQVCAAFLSAQDGLRRQGLGEGRSQSLIALDAALSVAEGILAAAERERIKSVGGVSACCGGEYHREPGVYGRWECHACGQQCDLIGTIG